MLEAVYKSTPGTIQTKDGKSYRPSTSGGRPMAAHIERSNSFENFPNPGVAPVNNKLMQAIISHKQFLQQQ